MISENKTKTKLQRGQPVFGVISTSPDPMLAELVGLCGYDYYMLDSEHGPISPAHAADFVRACEGVGVTPLVRVGQKDAKLVLQYMDNGMMGVMMPGLETVAEIKMLVNAVKYPPLGQRGLGLVRAADYMLGGMEQAEYIQLANANTLVWPQFEDAKLLKVFPQMAKVKGVDGFVIGPRDLSLSLKQWAGPAHPEVQSVIEKVLQIGKRAGVPIGLTAGTSEAARAELKRGALIILDAMPSLVRRGAQSFLKGSRA